MYTNRATINTTALANSGSNFTTYYYWSSTEADRVYAWGQVFSDGVQASNFKANGDGVRAVRAF